MLQVFGTIVTIQLAICITVTELMTATAQTKLSATASTSYFTVEKRLVTSKLVLVCTDFQ